MRIYELLRSKGFDVITVRPTTTVSEALALLKEYNLGAVVVSTDGKDISGILTERDVVRRLCDGPDFLDSPVSDVMTSEVFTCRAGESVQSLMNTMTEQRIRHLPVVDDFGRLSGLVSIGDVGEVTRLANRATSGPCERAPRRSSSQAAKSGVIATAFIDGPKAEAVTEVTKTAPV